MEEQIGSVEQYMKNCRLCPRECGADRTRGRAGRCGVGSGILIARAALHFWEEPCISGNAGSGAVFFTGCSLGCIYCQNAPISGVGHEMLGREVTITQLGDIFLRLQDKQHASNINLVTASHYIPQTAAALLYAKRKGLRIPVVYNSSGYEKADSLRMLEGLVDVYLFTRTGLSGPGPGSTGGDVPADRPGTVFGWNGDARRHCASSASSRPCERRESDREGTA